MAAQGPDRTTDKKWDTDSHGFTWIGWASFAAGPSAPTWLPAISRLFHGFRRRIFPPALPVPERGMVAYPSEHLSQVEIPEEHLDRPDVQTVKVIAPLTRVDADHFVHLYPAECL